MGAVVGAVGVAVTHTSRLAAVPVPLPLPLPVPVHTDSRLCPALPTVTVALPGGDRDLLAWRVGGWQQALSGSGLAVG